MTKQVIEFKELWSKASTPSEKNKAYQLLIDKIVYGREENGLITAYLILNHWRKIWINN